MKIHQDRHPKRSMTPKAWIWGAVVLSILICLVVSFIYFRQQQIISESLEVAEHNRQARIDLAKGFLHIGLAGEKDLPFNEHQGIVYLNQARQSFHETIQLLKPESDLAITVDPNLLDSFQKENNQFQQILESWAKTGKRDPSLETLLRIQYFKLEQQANLIDQIIAKEMSNQTAHFNATFYIAIVASAVFLTLFCLIVYLVVGKQLRMSKALLESEKQYRSLFDNMNNGLAHCELIFAGGQPADFVILNTNAAFDSITGQISATGKKGSELFPEIVAKGSPLFELFVDAATTGTVVKTEINLPQTATWLSVSVYSPNENQFVAMLENSTERKRNEENLILKNMEYQALNEEYLTLNEELQRNFNQLNMLVNELEIAKTKAEESDRLKTAFLQNTSHEIRTPLNAIMGFSELLADQFDNKAKLEEYTEIICERGADLLEIIDGILDFAKIESGQVSIHYEPFNLRKFVDELRYAYQEYQSRIKKPGIQFRATFNSHGLDETLVLDQAKLKQILNNLIANAFKFTHSGEITLNCHKLDDHFLSFSVSDTGIGIAKEKQATVFERFMQATNETSKLYGGTGLGLSIVKGLLDLLGGTLSLQSEPGKGSTFSFTFPYLTEEKKLPV